MRPAATHRLHDSHATALAWRPDGALVSAGLDGHLRVVDATGTPRPAGAPRGRGLVSLALDPHDPDRVLTGDLDGALTLWDLDAGRPGPPVRAHASSADGLVWAGNSGPVSAGADGVVRSWRGRGPAPEPDRELAPGAPGERVRWLAIRPDALVLAAAGAGGPVRVWAAGRFLEWDDAGRAVAGLAVHPDALAVALVAFAGHLEVREVPTGAVLRRSAPEYAQAEVPLAYSPDGARLAVGGAGRVRLLDAATLAVLAEDRLPGDALAVAFAPDGARLAVAGSDGRVRVYPL